ncbi:non-canonical purine NTP diphosphatase [Carboxylicivirga sp. N1Y90]|uniref:non-canonical purine NTP diphosphatase n=1 Tax=Carboxylicivirga fragile TaxID=3417571 RepID=UPI003D32509A|nr:non-canonical purine NTP diphosphatase [Marinilabiliaceae bacterium N1Y90]
MDLIFATNNQHKLEEIQLGVGDLFALKSLSDINCNDDIPETGSTLEANALQKARYIYDKYGKNCFADDTGLEIEALSGVPGVYSARYAGPERDAEANMGKVLDKLRDINNRSACFRTVVALIIDGEEWLFEGKVKGVILKDKNGEEGFGYDPIFQPEGYDVSFAQMPLSEKNKISHRARAVAKLIKFLKQNYGV